ncbi:MULTISPECIES: transcriptional regulator [Pseudomonas]|uniref:Helix-turn-helix domain-containing protein n=1 Tax=Pseudomonas juntendi TaxID=2666183 RepID=A0A7W2PSC0_9PSED|nr:MULTISPECIES: Cro/CI family transcriptional regulator [Pseudomonas]MBA6058957.1 helix-turn-helix domain-containing protein [Pseudomonas juntendi]MBA6126065.1 helix-turn-helix domain-containing protein [Pseudomonas juntendi]MCL8306403.1 helix-turn-helix domain-containing protein [Pseudomonas putida]
MKSAEAAKEASRVLGSQAELARRLSVAAPTVNQWCSGERAVPAKRALQIEALTNGAVNRADLCPSFPWNQIDCSASQSLSAA